MGRTRNDRPLPERDGFTVTNLILSLTSRRLDVIDDEHVDRTTA